MKYEQKLQQGYAQTLGSGKMLQDLPDAVLLWYFRTEKLLGFKKRDPLGTLQMVRYLCFQLG